MNVMRFQKDVTKTFADYKNAPSPMAFKCIKSIPGQFTKGRYYREYLEPPFDKRDAIPVLYNDKGSWYMIGKYFEENFEFLGVGTMVNISTEESKKSYWRQFIEGMKLLEKTHPYIHFFVMLFFGLAAIVLMFLILELAYILYLKYFSLENA